MAMRRHRSVMARGFDLDGDKGNRPHKSYTASDGRTGIDHQLFTMTGCIEGFRRKGLLMQTSAEDRRNGGLSMLIGISGIDDERNDDRVDVMPFYSDDPMVKNASGSRMLPDYTFTLSQKPSYTQFLRARTRAHREGVVVSGSLPTLAINDHRKLHLHEARLRLEIQPDGNLRSVLGGLSGLASADELLGAVQFRVRGLHGV